MKEFKENGNLIEITLDNDKVVKVSKKWVDNTMATLDTDMEDVLLMYLEDNDYLVNEEQQELDHMAKGKVKVAASAKPKAKTPRERTQKPQPEKEYIIGVIAEFLEDITDISNINIENKTKLITFSYKNEDYKLDLVQKRKKKEEKE